MIGLAPSVPPTPGPIPAPAPVPLPSGAAPSSPAAAMGRIGEVHFDVAEILGHERPWLVRGPLYLLALTLLCLVAWAGFTKFQLSVTADGRLRSVQPPQRVEALVTGRLTSLRFRVGAAVHRGDLLFELANEGLTTELSLKRSQREDVRRLLALQKEAGDEEGRRFGLARTNTALQLRRAQANLAWSRAELRRRAAMIKGGYATEAELELPRLRGQMPELRYGSQAARKQAASDELEHAFRMRASAEKVQQLTGQEEQLSLEIRKLEEELALCRREAPLDGTIVSRTGQTEGSRLAPGDLIYEIVPQSSELLVEVAVADKDRPRIWVGQEAALKLSAYPYRTHGTLRARVSFIASDAVAGTDGVHYPVRLTITETKGLRLAAGMTLEANLIERHKSVLAFLTDRLLRRTP